MAVEMYRMNVGMKRGATTWGKTDHYESREALERALLLARISVEKFQARGNMMYLLNYWADKILEQTKGNESVYRIVRVEQLVDGDWVPINYTFTPPSLVLELETSRDRA